MSKVRLDTLIYEGGYAEDITLAQRLILAGKIRVNGQVVFHPATIISRTAEINIDTENHFVSRGGDKLAAAIKTFKLVPAGLICADVGASSGGFTDCLLQNGAAKVYAIDVGKGILEWKLRQDPRVVVMEKTNARFVEKLPESIAMATIDVSFISLRVILPVIRHWLAQDNQVIALIKPQFEATRKEVSRGRGVIRDVNIHQSVIQNILTYSQEQGFSVKGLIRSPLFGPKGNTEFLAWLKWYPNFQTEESNVQEIITSLFQNATELT